MPIIDTKTGTNEARLENGDIVTYDACSEKLRDDVYDRYPGTFTFLGYGWIHSINGVRQREGGDKYSFYKKTSK